MVRFRRLLQFLIVRRERETGGESGLQVARIVDGQIMSFTASVSMRGTSLLLGTSLGCEVERRERPHQGWS